MSRPLYRIPVPPTERSTAGYEVVVGPGIWGKLPALIEKACLAHRYAVITDHRVAELYGTGLMRALHSAGYRADIFAFPAGEAQKSRETWLAVSDAMIEAGVGRDAAVVALGGGVAGDLAGFVAATYLRGLPVVQLPTTLLAMIDSSLGGKTGVNTAAGKNLIGAFWPPRVVVVDPEVLVTLPQPHVLAGLAEAVKHAAIADAEYFASIGSRSAALAEASPDPVCELVVRSVEIKSEFVARDEYETGPRKALNFGHTVGHALEAASEYTLLHGEAVAIGMVAEARIGELCGVTEPGTADALRGLLVSLGLPTTLPREMSVDRVLAHARSDKKNRGGRTEYTLLARIGAVDSAGERWSHPVADETARQALSAAR